MLDHYLLHPSRTYGVWMIVALLLTITSVFLANLGIGARILLIALVALGIFPALWREALLRHATSWQSITLQQRNVHIARREASEVVGAIMHRTLVTPLCIVLWVKPEAGSPLSQVIFRDALPEDAFRELCVRLKYC